MVVLIFAINNAQRAWLVNGRGGSCASLAFLWPVTVKRNVYEEARQARRVIDGSGRISQTDERNPLAIAGHSGAEGTGVITWNEQWLGIVTLTRLSWCMTWP